ncbi:MAG: hypothetical protein KatS3mg003_0582 [Candidatus Nitrosocaldaceae archaeon]|nr:MAG: hypothetical protein KatS3mg003_0582 [Candidatus Nitrosocaldaceae archaeon]
MSDIDAKYQVEIKSAGKSLRLSNEVKDELKSIGMMDEKGKLKITGVSAKMLRQMKQEYVDCPVLNKEVPFIQCYICKNFISRIKGQVYCKGEAF